MAFTLVLNSANNVGSTNTQFQYKFLTGNFVAKDMEMCLSSAAIPYSFFNVSTYYNNNTFSIIFPTGATTQTLSITLPNGFYQISDINSYIQNQCLLNGIYLINASLQNVFFFEMVVNVSTYTIQTVYFPVPTSATGYTLPPSGTYSTVGGLPTVANRLPQLVLPANAPLAIMGFATGTYPATASSATSVSVSSTSTPIGSAINSLIARCNCLKNTIAMPSDILDAFPINADFGGAILYNPNFEKWISIGDGTYSNIIFSLVDQNFNTINAQDPNVCITLLIRKKGY